MKKHHGRTLWVMLINRNGLLGALFLATSGISASVLFGVGCGLNFGPQKLYCDPDGGDCANFPECCDDAGTGIAPQSLKCEDKGGACVAIGNGDFETDAVLLWIGGEENDAPKCPDRAPTPDDDMYFADLVVDVQCEECKCNAPTCVLPHAIGVDPQLGCVSGISDNYAAPNDWDGSCFSSAKLPVGSFASFALPSATVTDCTPLSSPPIKPPGAMAPRSDFIFGGVGWKQAGKVCNGTANGECKAGDSCVPNAEPRPPDFQYCLRYKPYAIDEANLPQCPAAFPERHLFYKRMEGKRECTECTCGEPIGSQCIAAFSAYQDPACGDNPAPFFKDFAGGQCIIAMPWSLSAISAK
ncbi:MAG TPA: hypothetical protein PK156_43385 [Polyangium sp.]|nr:hypothetical protein [Polyangium sp.]